MNQYLPPKDAYFFSAKAEDPSLLVCAESYFSQIKDAFLNAQEEILILGWSFNLKTILDDDGTTLEEILFGIPDKVKIKILVWDYIIFYMADRDPFIGLNIAFKNKKNIQFGRFDFHPMLSSMHIKMVVVDSEVSFVGGIDLDLERRDGKFNFSEDSMRREKDGHMYGPFRDYALRFEGKQIAKDLRTFFEQMWNSQKEQVSRVHQVADKLTPGANLFFARTLPKFKGNPKDNSSFQLQRWLFENAKRYIFIENQYLTSGRIVDALIQRLAQPLGPEVVIVVSYGHMPILERISMGALLTDCVKKLLHNDPYQRLKIYTLLAPRKRQASLRSEGREFVKIHSKCVLVDDTYLKIGSSNMNERSLQFDYELDALVSGEVVKKYREEIFSSLLGNGGEVEFGESIIWTFEKARLKYDKIIEVKDILQKKSALTDYKDYLPLDKREMTFFEKMGQMFIHRREMLRINAKVVGGIVLLLFIIAGAIFVGPGEAKGLLDQAVFNLRIDSSLLLMGLFFFSYLILGAFFFPLNAYIFLCGAYFSMGEAFALAMTGAMSSAMLTYAMGTLFQKDLDVEAKLEQANRLGKLLRRNSLKTLVFLRIIPLAPFPFVNLVCGKLRMHFGKYVLGTLLGVAPGAAFLIFTEKRLIALFTHPDWGNFVVVILILSLFYAGGRFLKKRMSA